MDVKSFATLKIIGMNHDQIAFTVVVKMAPSPRSEMWIWKKFKNGERQGGAIREINLPGNGDPILVEYSPPPPEHVAVDPGHWHA